MARIVLTARVNRGRFVGNHYGLEIDPQEITPENFDSVGRLAEFILRKKAQAGSRRTEDTGQRSEVSSPAPS